MNCLLSYISISTWDTIKTNIIQVYLRSTQRCINVHVRHNVRHKICHIYTSMSLTTVIKIAGTCRRVNQKDEIRGYIKARSKLVCSLKQLMIAYGPSCVSYDTVRRWKIKFNLA